jgi:peptidoglycan/LPS O-acetylase OafA/YrhL
MAVRMAAETRGRPECGIVAERRPALDGLRAVFVLGVIAFHLWGDSHDWKIDPGSAGVVGFFALSGYLITGLLIKEHADTGSVQMRYFYARRALRLLPALFLFLGVWFLVDLLFQHGQFLATVPSAHTPGNPVPWTTGLGAVVGAAGYVTNWLNAASLWSHWHTYSPISHLWTLAVEEQFYVIWAPVMLLLLRLRRPIATVIAGIIAVVALLDPVLLSSSSFNRVYFGTDARCGALFCGALAAFVASTNGWRVLRAARWAPTLGAVLVGLIAWSAYALRQDTDRGLWNMGLIICSLSCAAAVAFIAERPEGIAGRLLSSRLLVGIGQRSYALYLWSYVLNTWLRDTGFWEPVLVLGTSFLMAEVSYRLVERPALRLKHHFEPSDTRRNDPENLEDAEGATGRRKEDELVLATS